MKKSGHTVLITGVASGIGLALAEQFVRSRSKVVIVGRDTEKLERAKLKLPELHAIACDLGREEELERLIGLIGEKFAEVSVLINNAGIQHNGRLLDDPADGDRIAEETRVNLLAPMTLCARLLPLLAKRPEAAVVNVTSALGLVPKPSAPVYCATKAGLRLFTKALRAQLAGTPIRVFELMPPLVDTAMTAGRGSGKMPPSELAAAFMRSFERDRLEAAIGKARLLRTLSRLLPGMAERLMRRG
ncbi:SDR family oxidoreductase [Paenibacillus sp. MBLB4367]|uniref:SDR family oxidoreductase n=1 Tax=Paenibacillus sp. MBLB4367 TaxID=3384767 RepID=UPI0039084440